MLVYDFICSRGHQFEGWFANLEDMETQLASHGLTCPVCGDENISRKPSTFGLIRSTNRGSADQKPGGPAEPPSPAQFQELLKSWAEASERFTRDFEDVGPSFAEEALKMHYGVTDRRNIRGQSTESQDEMLRQEGVDFIKIPLLSRKGSSAANN